MEEKERRKINKRCKDLFYDQTENIFELENQVDKLKQENTKLKVKLEEINSKYILLKPSRRNNKKNIILYVFELVNSLDILNKALYLACEKEYGTNTGNPFLKYKWEIKDYVNDYIKKAEAELEKKKDDKKYC